MSWKDNFPRDNIYFETENGVLYRGDCLDILNNICDSIINLIVTSPPYNKKSANKRFTKKNTWRRANINYGGYSDNLPENEYQNWQRNCLKEFIRILKDNGSIFYNHKPRIVNNQIIFPNEWLYDFIVRQLIIWDRKGSPNIENVRFFPVVEYIYWITKKRKTPKFYKRRAIFSKEIWEFPPDISTRHPAPFPIQLPMNCILTTTDKYDLVLDPFIGSGTTAIACEKLNRRWIGIEINSEYCEITKQRLLSIKEV